MDQAEFDRVAASFAAFHAEFAPLFGRREAQRRSERDVRGLLVQQTHWRNAENVAEMIVGAPPHLPRPAHRGALADGSGHRPPVVLRRGTAEYARGYFRAR